MVHLELPDEKMGFSDGKGEMFTVSSGGEILWSRQASFRIACKMNLDKLPFDTQSCGLLAGLYSQRAEQVQLRWRDAALTRRVATRLTYTSITTVAVSPVISSAHVATPV